MFWSLYHRSVREDLLGLWSCRQTEEDAYEPTKSETSELVAFMVSPLQ